MLASENHTAQARKVERMYRMPNRNSTIAEKFPIHLHLYWMRGKEGVVVGSWIILWELIPQSWELAPPPPERHSFLSNFFVNETQYFSLYPFRGRRFWFQILFRSRNIGIFNFLGSNWKMVLLNSSHMELLKQDDEDDVPFVTFVSTNPLITPHKDNRGRRWGVSQRNQLDTVVLTEINSRFRAGATDE